MKIIKTITENYEEDKSSLERDSEKESNDKMKKVVEKAQKQLKICWMCRWDD